MKTLITLVATTLSISLTAQVRVEEKSVNIDGSKNGFYISIPYGDDKQIEKALKEELQGWKGKYSTKGYIFVDDCSIKDMGDNTFDVYAIIEDIQEGGATVSIAIDLGGAYMSSGQHSSQFSYMKSRLTTFGIKAAKSAVDDEIKAEEEILKQKQKELTDLEADQAKKEKEIEDYKAKIAENEKAIEESKKNQETKKGEIKEQETKVQGVVAKKEAIK
ncbi:MAG: hypothetical protein HYZ14_18245 [Bacteroidetes bacterium]|nr:hypothetical protein [Bacteroidota bacterium]